VPRRRNPDGLEIRQRLGRHRIKTRARPTAEAVLHARTKPRAAGRWAISLLSRKAWSAHRLASIPASRCHRSEEAACR